MQNGSYVPGRQIQSTQSVSNYTVFPFADLEGYDDMTPTLGTCFANTTGVSISPTLTGLVDACTQQNGLCCYKASSAGDQVKLAQAVLSLICMTCSCAVTLLSASSILLSKQYSVASELTLVAVALLN